MKNLFSAGALVTAIVVYVTLWIGILYLITALIGEDTIQQIPMWIRVSIFAMTNLFSACVSAFFFDGALNYIYEKL